MSWLWIIIALAGLLLLRSTRRKRKRKQGITVAAIRSHFPGIARMRLIAACPGLEGVLEESDLRLVFDWILIELCRRTGANGLGELMQWSVERGEAKAAQLTGEVTREAVDRMPYPVLEVIDGCEGRTVAGVLLDEALTEAGHRVAPQKKVAR